MSERPSNYWRNEAKREAKAIETGILSANDAVFLGVYPDAFLDQIDRALESFEARAGELGPASSDPEVLTVVEEVILDLNKINREANEGSIDTDEREQLCLYVDAVLVQRRIDVDALAIRNGTTRHGITDRWRSGGVSGPLWLGGDHF